jgi:hypothetical protein
MKIRPCSLLLLTCAAAGVASSASAGDRVRAGQWDTTLNLAGMTMSKSVCLSPGDAAALNGDATSIRTYVDKINATTPSGCKVTDVKASGDQVTVKSVCAGGRETEGTTTYHGDSYETVTANGTKAQAKWVGACK